MGAHCAEHADGIRKRRFILGAIRDVEDGVRVSGDQVCLQHGIPDTGIAAAVDVAEAGQRRLVAANTDLRIALGLQFALAVIPRMRVGGPGILASRSGSG